MVSVLPTSVHVRFPDVPDASAGVTADFADFVAVVSVSALSAGFTAVVSVLTLSTGFAAVVSVSAYYRLVLLPRYPS
jgi:hypothetical protein